MQSMRRPNGMRREVFDARTLGGQKDGSYAIRHTLIVFLLLNFFHILGNYGDVAWLLMMPQLDALILRTDKRGHGMLMLNSG